MHLQWRNQFWQSLEEGAGERCSVCDLDAASACRWRWLELRPARRSGYRHCLYGVNKQQCPYSFGGDNDSKAKTLRHSSPHFSDRIHCPFSDRLHTQSIFRSDTHSVHFQIGYIISPNSDYTTADPSPNPTSFFLFLFYFIYLFCLFFFFFFFVFFSFFVLFCFCLFFCVLEVGRCWSVT